MKIADENRAEMNQVTARFTQVEAIFHEALDSPEERRQGLITARCGTDTELADEVRSLLQASREEEKASAWRLDDAETAGGEPPARKHVGPYEIDRLLGRGGMGAVYLAHRADGQFEQQVAIKLIDLPLATSLFKERFRLERQILAGLHHPYIARLLDGGVTAEGDLYLAMEFVDGVPIDRFCAERKLTEAQRIALFLRVCEAVQFAHQNFVVHRDLKPDNILVAEDGTPRLLDFGTAKLLSPSLEKPESQLTREGYRSFTPQYASPEQILGNPITTASDTYALGVLLYRLLTDTLPYEIKELTMAEMLRTVCEQPPGRPFQSVAPNKRLDPDLEAILLKALRKEPLERYLTAEQLASDLRAYLEGKPVAARRGTLRYRSCKFVRRHRWGLAAAGILAVTMMAGVVGVVWQARVANMERRKAEARSADLRQLSNSLLSELDEAIKELPGSTGAQKLLVTRVLEHLDRMGKDAQGDRQTQLDLVDAYTRLGNLQGNEYYQNLGDAAGALTSFGKARAIAAPLAAANPKDREAVRTLALVDQSRSEILWQSGKTPEAVFVLRQAVKSLEALAASPQASAPLIADAAGAYADLGDELGQPGMNGMDNPAEAIAAYRNGLALTNRALSVDPGLVRARRAIPIAAFKIGTIEIDIDPAQAITDLEIALHYLDTLPANDQTTLTTQRMRALTKQRMANALVQLGRYKDAARLFDECAQAQQRIAAQDAQDWRALADLQSVLNQEAAGFEAAADPALATDSRDRLANLASAEVLLTQAVAMVEKGLKKEPSNDSWRAVLADLQVRLSAVQSTLHPRSDFSSLARKGLATLREIAGKDPISTSVLDHAANAFLIAEPESLRDAQFALSSVGRAVAMSQRRSPAKLLTLAQAYRANGEFEKSRATAVEALALLPPSQPGSAKPRMRKLLEIQTR